jgi:hypothetical protein
LELLSSLGVAMIYHISIFIIEEEVVHISGFSGCSLILAQRIGLDATLLKFGDDVDGVFG